MAMLVGLGVAAVFVAVARYGKAKPFDWFEWTVIVACFGCMIYGLS